MIIGLLIALGATAIALWISTMYVWWQKEQETDTLLASEKVLDYWQTCTRFARRGWYRTVMYTRAGLMWCNRKIASLFFVLFPNAEPAFIKKDELAGLQHGPSSYFLLSITEKRNAPIRKTRTRKAIS